MTLRSRTRFLLVSSLVIVFLVSTRWALAAPPAASPDPQAVSQQEDKADKERKKKEDKAAQKDLRDAKADKDVLDELQPKMDAIAQGMLPLRYDDRFLQDYVNELGQSLVPKETPSGVLFSFRVLKDATPNAFALADGRTYVNTGLLAFVQNEAQLAFVLAHEISHVTQQHQVKRVRESRSFMRTVMPGLVGAALGGIVGGVVKGKEGAGEGALIGGAAGFAASLLSINAYDRKQEDEADLAGAKLLLDAGYDSREAVAFFDKLLKTFGDRDRFSNLLYASHSTNQDRMNNIRKILDGDLASRYNSLSSAGKLTLGTGQMQIYTSRMFRDVAIDYMDEYDRYDIAKALLESIVDYRARDPKTLWAIGRVYKMVGRTPADKAKGLDYLQRAAQIDERNMYPYINRDLALMQARFGAPSMPAAIESLKKYIQGHTAKYDEYPSDLEQIYDYLLIFGDSKWTAPRMENRILRVANQEPPPAPRAEPGTGADAKKALQPAPKPKKPGKSGMEQ
jgi:beta-barrel assembly-enhancing protease